MISSTHPYWHVRSIVERRRDIATLSFSYYTYHLQSVVDHRSVWQLSSAEFLVSDRMEAAISATPAKQELAIHSDVKLCNGERRHFVVIDMSTSAKAHLDKLRAFLGDNFFQQIAWYTSGRSFHGYGEDLLSEQEWVQFMGLLLLANKPRMEPTVDPRWIGHRLLAGYSALRWTRNTSHYLVSPTLIKQPERSTLTPTESSAKGN